MLCRSRDIYIELNNRGLVIMETISYKVTAERISRHDFSNLSISPLYLFY